MKESNDKNACKELWLLEQKHCINCEKNALKCLICEKTAQHLDLINEKDTFKREDLAHSRTTNQLSTNLKS